ncbi:hypothetical protein [Cellulomonas hominis]
MTRLRWILLAVAAMSVGSCSAPGQHTTDSPWSAPTWMAEQAQQQEQFVVRLQACMDSKGWNLTAGESAGFAEPFSDSAEMERAGADRDACLGEQGIDPNILAKPLTESTLRTMYAFDVDTHECLVAQGIEMEGAPPTVDRYVEEGLAAQAGVPVDDPWWPYGDPAILGLDEQGVAELKQVCPERWTFASLS